MNDAILVKKLNELVYEIGAMPNAQRKEPILLTKKRVYNPQELLDYLRISIKYLLFDLEATRRENTHFKKLLENI